MNADNPQKIERFRTRVARYLKLYFCFAQFFAQERAFSVWFAINNRSLRMQRSNEAAIQSDCQTTISSRSQTGKTALTSARGDQCRVVLERRSRCNRNGASQLFHRPHLATQSYFAANRQIDAETSR